MVFGGERGGCPLNPQVNLFGDQFGQPSYVRVVQQKDPIKIRTNRIGAPVVS